MRTVLCRGAQVSAFIVPVDVAFSLSRAYDGFFVVSCVMDGFSIVDQLISWRTSFIQGGPLTPDPSTNFCRSPKHACGRHTSKRVLH